ncbi:hypothetical protein B0H19DRAFT_1083379 [Mycena capillaripes]|nr:hypothetical protein B0H19DRAFT_1083379 [Mycena capillaripes]
MASVGALPIKCHEPTVMALACSVTQAAKALHLAVAKLRGEPNIPFRCWVLFVYYRFPKLVGINRNYVANRSESTDSGLQLSNITSDMKALKDTTQKNYAAIKQELTLLTQLQNTLSGFGPVLESQPDAIDTLQTRTATLENNVLDVGVFVGGTGKESFRSPVRGYGKDIGQDRG